MPRERPLGPPPNERPNWDSMNNGQKRYAMEQWMLARVRRGERFAVPGEEEQESEPNAEDLERYFDPDAILNVLGSPQEHQESQSSPLNTQESAAADAFIKNIMSNQAPVQNMEVDSSATKTAGTSENGNASKKLKTGDGNAAKGQSSAPGTGRNTDGFSGGGETGHGLIPIQRPLGMQNFIFNRTYRKNWRFLSYGVADRVLTGPNSSAALTTSLANIPWEYAFFYLSPAEWNEIRNNVGMRAVRAHITIEAYNTRVAFETGGTESSRATLNQNKFLRVAKNIRSKSHIYSNNRIYTFDATETMKPIGFSSQTASQYRQALQTSMYGVEQSQLTTQQVAGAYITGQEMVLEQYLTVYTPGTGTSVGFPPYNNFVNEYNASDLVGTALVEMSYDFQFAPLSAPREFVESSMIDTVLGNQTMATGNQVEGLCNRKWSMDHTINPSWEATPQVGYISGTHQMASTAFTHSSSMYEVLPMEQGGQYYMSRAIHEKRQTQPSIHVGVRAVPKLTTTDGNFIESWLDTQAYFVVSCSLDVTNDEPYAYSGDKSYAAPSNEVIAKQASNNLQVVQELDSVYVYGQARERVVPP